MKKRWISLLLTSVLVFGCVQPVFADEAAEEYTETEPVFIDEQVKTEDEIPDISEGDVVEIVPEIEEEFDSAPMMEAIEAEPEEELQYADDSEYLTVWYDTNGGVFGTYNSGETKIGVGYDVGEEVYPNGAVITRREGYAFNGWYTEKECRNRFVNGTVITEDITLYAGWTTNYYTVTFDANGGSFSSRGVLDSNNMVNIAKNTSLYETIGSAITQGNVNFAVDDPTSPHNGKIGWIKFSYTRNGNDYVDYNRPITQNTVVYANWKPESVTSGWKSDTNGWKYYFADGTMAKGWKSISGVWYYFKSDGYMAANEWAKDSKGWCWMNSSGMITKDKWIQSGGEWYYLKSNGYMAAREWAKDSGGWYWMNASGKITKNTWIQYGSEWYYLKSNGYMAANEWAKDSGGWYWMDGSGKITKNKWIKYNNEWYYLGSGGYMVANGWAKDSGGWYWMDGSGKITKNKWIRSGGEWYYLKANGYMAANEWAKDSGGWYWMAGSGKITKNQWVQTGGAWYYLGTSGYMVTGKQTISGKTYTFASNGKLIS